ncbi:MAG: crossover junction endodeoxyribonuclease RuvC [Actinomycetota bacterium]
MFESVGLGVDPGVASVGLAIVAKARPRTSVVWSETVRTETALAEAERLRRISQAVRGAIAAHRPSALALERVMWGQNRTSALSVARATGVIMVAAAEAGIPVDEYAPLEVKMAITGIGNADKNQVRTALIRVLKVDGVPAQADAADAVAVALCHLQQSALRRAARTAGIR